MIYRQCHLAKSELTGTVEQIAWIPSHLAVSNIRLRIKNDAGEWEDGWIVIWVGADDVEESSIAPYAYGQIRRNIKS